MIASNSTKRLGEIPINYIDGLYFVSTCKKKILKNQKLKLLKGKKKTTTKNYKTYSASISNSSIKAQEITPQLFDFQSNVTLILRSKK